MNRLASKSIAIDSFNFDLLNQVAIEQLDMPEAIQPHGVLLVLSNPKLRVVKVSANSQDYLDIAPEKMLGRPLTALFDPEAIIAVEQALSRLGHASSQGFIAFSLRIGEQGCYFDALLYPSADAVILELEPVLAASSPPLMSVRTGVSQAMARLRQVSDFKSFLELATLEVQQIIGFDRVMIYRFDAQGSGEVIAEAKRGELPSYVGLHYPATDLPEPARVLYQHGMVRYIPDLTAAPVALMSRRQMGETFQPLDLRLSSLRSIDPCSAEFHRNMGVSALLVIPLLQGNRLWGLVSCHHTTPHWVPYETREGATLLGQLIASELSNKVNTEEIQSLGKVRFLQSKFIQSISQAEDLRQALVDPAPDLLDLVAAQGVAICLEDEITLVGATPTLAQVQELLYWSETQIPIHEMAHQALFHTDSLPQYYRAAHEYKDVASGLLVLQISKVRHYTILWFRSEVLQTVNWAGDPRTSLSMTDDGSLVLCPRQSFDHWQQIVRLTSLPWQASELDAALDLRNAIVGIVLRKVDELAQVNQALESSIRELDSFAYAASHDLKEPLRGIHNFSHLLLKGYGDKLDDTGKARLQTLVRLTRRMESLIDALLKFSRLGQTELQVQTTNLDPLLQQILDEIPLSHPVLETEIRVPQALPTVQCDSILMQDVLVNLISNAIKYNDKLQKWVEIGYYQDKCTTFYVRDNGIGIRERHQTSIFRLFKRLHEQHLYGGGTGAGLTIAKKIIERHGGRIWVESIYGQGSTFYFTLDT
jgi:two-component system, chemotaxis family, sensor kinase Cph1